MIKTSIRERLIDALIGDYTCVRKTFKWTVKVVMHFNEEAAHNAFILFGKVYPGKIRFMNFKMEVIDKAITRARLNSDSSLSENSKIGRHFLEVIPPTEKKANSQKRSVECTKKGKRKESRCQCKNCVNHPGLCPAPCFELYNNWFTKKHSSLLTFVICHWLIYMT